MSDRINSEESKKLAEEHWSYIEALLLAHGEKDILEVIGFHYKSAFIHGFKHGVEFIEEGKR